jgi:hypothetical protein
MNRKVNLMVACGISLALAAGVVAQGSPSKNSAVVLKSRGQVFFQFESENGRAASSSLTEVKTLQSLAGRGSFLAKPGSEVTFYDFRTASRVTIKVPQEAKQEVRFSVGSSILESHSTAVSIKSSPQLAGLKSGSLAFRESMGAASGRKSVNQGLPNKASTAPETSRRYSTAQPSKPSVAPVTSGGGSIHPSSPSPDTYKTMSDDDSGGLQSLGLYTISASPTFELSKEQVELLGSGSFYLRRHTNSLSADWAPTKIELRRSDIGYQFSLDRRLAPGEAIDGIMNTTKPQPYLKPTFVVARYQQETIDSLHKQEQAAKSLDTRLEYLAGLTSLGLFEDASKLAKKLAKQYPSAQDWSQIHNDILQQRSR